MKYVYDWNEISTRWKSGESAGMISKNAGMPSKQAINRKAKKEGWERKVPEVLPGQFPMIAGETTVQIPPDLDPRKRMGLLVLSNGGNYKDAATAACVSEETFRVWRKDPGYLALVLQVETGIKLEMLSHIRNAAPRDAKHAEWWLKHHPSTKGEFGDGMSMSNRRSTTNCLAGVFKIDRSKGDEKPIDVTPAEPEVLEQKAESEQVEAEEDEPKKELKPEDQKSPQDVDDRQVLLEGGREKCPECRQTYMPGLKHLCLARKGYLARDLCHLR